MKSHPGGKISDDGARHQNEAWILVRPVPSLTMQAAVTSAKLQYLLSVPDYSVARNNPSHLRNSLAHRKLVPHVEIHSHKWCVT